MDCCRSARRLGGEQVTVVVRSGFEEMKASPWEKEDAMHEGIPIRNFLVPEGSAARRRPADRHGLREGAARNTMPRAAASWCPSGEPDEVIEADDVLVAIGQENSFPWIERDIGLEFDRWGLPELNAETHQSTIPNVFFGGDAAFGPKNIIWAVAHGHEAAVSIDLFCRGEDVANRPSPETVLTSQKMGIHEWSYDNDVSLDLRFKVPHAEAEVALRDITAEVELGYDREMAFKEAERCLNCDVQTVFSASLCIECDACVDICPVDCITFTADGEEAELRTRLKAPAQNLTQDLYCQDGLKTGRVMVKDEDVCLHCGMCAERCPTGAWDMQKFLLRSRQAPAARRRCTHAQRDITVDERLRRQIRQRQRVRLGQRQPAVCQVDPAHGHPHRLPQHFPSNIQGLPTWFEVRVSGEGHLGRRGGVDLMVAINPQTWDRDIAEIDAGGYLLYDNTRPMPASRFRADINVIGVPLTQMCNAAYTDARQRQLLKNIMYVGALSALLNIEPPVVEQLLAEQYKGKEKLAKPNRDAFHMGRDWALKNLACPIGLTLERSDAVGDRIYVEGNAAAALGAVYGGATVCAWYPITPSTSLAEAFERYCKRFRTEAETGKKRYAIVQAEDELASIGIVIGAAWNGARAFTATSGPGISLMQEFVGLAYFAEIPAVIFDVQRGGPSHRHADPHPAIRPARRRLCQPWRHQAGRAAARKTRMSASNSARPPSTWRIGCRRRSS